MGIGDAVKGVWYGARDSAIFLGTAYAGINASELTEPLGRELRNSPDLINHVGAIGANILGYSIEHSPLALALIAAGIAIKKLRE